MRRLPEGFHVVNSMDRGDHVGLTPEEVKEERRARKEEVNGRKRERGPRVLSVRPPFEILLKECGLYDRVKEITLARGVSVLELHVEGRSTKRVHAARRDVFRFLRTLDWSYPDIGKLFSIDHTTVMAAVK